MIIKTHALKAGEMAQQLKALGALAEDQGLKSRHPTWQLITIYNSSSKGCNPFSGLGIYVMHRKACSQTLININTNNNNMNTY